MTDDYIEHYGVPRRSGRYPWGSGERPYQGDTKKAMLMRKYEKAKSKARAKSEEMAKSGKSQKEINEHDWRENNKLDNIQRKITRLEFKDVADSLGIRDKSVRNAMADYEWAKKTVAKYEATGRTENKLDETGFAKDAELNRKIRYIPFLGPWISDTVYMTKSHTLKGSEYYEEISKNLEGILNEKIPDYVNKKG